MQLTGLTDSQVLSSRAQYGSNQMPQPQPKSAWYFFKEVFHDKINVILLVMMFLFLGLSAFGYGSVFEAMGIGLVLFVVALVTVITRLKSQRSTMELRRRASQLYANVLRNGCIVHLDASDLVVGDIVMIAAGETICADGYMIRGRVAVNNAILNGESAECDKQPVPGFTYNRALPIGADDYTNAHYVFAGTTVQSGEGLMIVTRVGLETENAKILTTLHNIDEVKTALQIQLDNLAEKISRLGSISAALICIVLFSAHIYQNGFGTGGELLFVLLNTVTIALTIFVAAVPEGLPFIIGIITGQNVKTMIRKNILAKNPNKIPEAGNIQLLCTDKTGTLTHGNLCAVANFSGDGTDIGFAFDSANAVSVAFANSVLINGRAVFDSMHEIVGGNSTERALLAALNPDKDLIDAVNKDSCVEKRAVFDSAKKYSATQVKLKSQDGTVCYYMGAPEKILSCAKAYLTHDGLTAPIDASFINKLIARNTSRAMRVVALAYSKSELSKDAIHDDLVFVSLVTMRDELRPGVIKVISDLRKSNVQIMMITGDILDTARVIATDCGIISSASDIAITSNELESMSDDEAIKKLPLIKVIARATPSTKLRVVMLAQRMGLCIGMCGDGTNDAPALKRADVGFAMGNSTDVCKESSDIIITDNNFISVANSILLGRTFMHNVISFLSFQLPINFALVILSMVFPLLVGLDALCAVQILIINIVMDSLNSLAFGGEPPHAEYMSEPAAGKNAPLLSRQTLFNVAWSTMGFVLVFCLLLLPPIRNLFPVAGAYASARFALLVIMAIINGFGVRTPGYNLFRGISNNPMFVIVALGVIAGTMLCVSFGGSILQLSPLNLHQWLVVFGLSLLIVPVNFIRIYFCRKRKKSF